MVIGILSVRGTVGSYDGALTPSSPCGKPDRQQRRQREQHEPQHQRADDGRAPQGAGGVQQDDRDEDERGHEITDEGHHHEEHRHRRERTSGDDEVAVTGGQPGVGPGRQEDGPRARARHAVRPGCRLRSRAAPAAPLLPEQGARGDEAAARDQTRHELGFVGERSADPQCPREEQTAPTATASDQRVPAIEPSSSSPAGLVDLDASFRCPSSTAPEAPRICLTSDHTSGTTSRAAKASTLGRAIQPTLVVEAGGQVVVALHRYGEHEPDEERCPGACRWP